MTTVTHEKRNDVELFVLDVLQHDIENATTVLRLINNDGCIGWRKFWPHDFTIDEISAALLRLHQAGYVKPLAVRSPDGELHDYAGCLDVATIAAGVVWFTRTEEGIKVWEQWTPPIFGVRL